MLQSQINIDLQEKRYRKNHGFRKFFDTNLMRARIMPVHKEMLMEHTTGLDDVYYKPEQSEIMFEYLKAVDNLTINEKNKLRLQLEEEKEDHKKQLEKITSEIDSIKEEAMTRVIAKGEVKPL